MTDKKFQEFQPSDEDAEAYQAKAESLFKSSGDIESGYC
jgi:hypothetical protein